MRGARHSLGGLRNGWFAPVCAVLVGAWGGPAHAGTLRMGEHDGFGRVVFTLPPGAAESSLRTGDRLLVKLPGAGDVPGAVAGPSNVPHIEGGRDQAVLVLAPGSVTRIWRTGPRVVVDVYPGGAPPTAPAGRGAAPRHTAGATASASASQTAAAAMGTPEFTLVPVNQGPLPPAPAPAAAPAAKAAATPQRAPAPAVPEQSHDSGAPPPVRAPAPPDASAEAAALLAERVPEEVAQNGVAQGDPAILVPFGRSVGAVAFPRGGLAHVVFDDAKPIDLAGLKNDPVFGSARVTLLAAATQMTIKLPAGARLRLLRQPDGWVVAVAQSGRADAAARIALDKGVLTLAVPSAADTVVLDDGATGGRLLGGTVLAPGAGVAVPHVSPEFTVLPSWAGIVVAANGDRLALRAGKSGFELANNSGPALAASLAEAADSAAEAAALTRHFDFPPLPAAALLMRLRAAMHAAATAPPLGRWAPRLQVAQAMLALGLDREAAGVLRVAQQDAPDQAAAADEAALLAMADWLAGLEPGTALADPALGKSDEIAFWRALAGPQVADQRSAAAGLAATWRLLLAYPEPLRRRLARPVAEAMLQGGQTAAVDALLKRLPGSALDDVRASRLAQQNQPARALALLDSIAARPDRRQAAAAARAAVELRLAAHQISPAQAAAALEKQIFAWREPATELALRLRLAELRTQAGEWRPALALLRETDAMFPADHDQVHAAEVAVIADLLKAGQAERLPPLDLVALADESTDLISSEDGGSALAPVIADKLLALDLPDRAEPILARLMDASPAAEPKAQLGLRLAGLRLNAGQAAGAIAALDASEAPDLPDPLRTQRGVLRGRALAAAGQQDAALALLATLDGAEALNARATILEGRRDWRGAETALLALLRDTLPAQGKLTVAQQDLVLRVASDASEAGDMAVLQQLQNGDAARLDAGARPALFQALAEQPVQTLQDLPRSGREATASREVPAALVSLSTR
jgi:hypothetical protein